MSQLCVSLLWAVENSCLRTALSHFDFVYLGTAYSDLDGLPIQPVTALTPRILERHLFRRRLDGDDFRELLKLAHGSDGGDLGRAKVGRVRRRRRAGAALAERRRHRHPQAPAAAALRAL